MIFLNPNSLNRISPLILAGFLFFLSCTLNRSFNPVPEENQSLHPLGDQMVLVSLGKTTGVGAYLYFNENNDLALHLIYSNRSGRPLLLLPGKITMTRQLKTGKNQTIQVFSAMEYIQKLQSDLAMDRIEATIDGALEPPTNREVQRFIQRYSVNDLTYVTQPGISMKTNPRYGATRLGDSFVQESAFQGIRQPLLTKMTLYPDQFAEGNVIVENKLAPSYTVIVPFGGESHRFVFFIK